MKVRVEYVRDEEEEIVIKCRVLNTEIVNLIEIIKNTNEKLKGIKNGETYLLNPKDVYYFETVDKSTYIYTDKEVYKTSLKLKELEEVFSKIGFFRCSKSMVININSIVSLKSEMGNRINVMLKNGEHIIISRRYAKMFREILQS